MIHIKKPIEVIEVLESPIDFTEEEIKMMVPLLPYACPESCSADGIKDTSKEVETLARCVYWLRSLKKGKEWCIQHHCFPGPYGIKSQSGVWYPKSRECCDMDLSPSTIKTEKSIYLDKWSIYKHCLTLEHVRYLVIKKGWSVIHTETRDILDKIYPIMAKKMNDIPLIINDKEEFTNLLVKSILSGMVKPVGDEYL